jgi:phosphoribosylglycinamide formyltransferase-1
MATQKPRILALASGTKTCGGSGFQELVEFSRTRPPVLDAEIVCVVSNHQNGGVSRRADALGVQFAWWPGPKFTADGYDRLMKMLRPDYVMLSGWVKLTQGLRPERTVNIHPGPLPRFGGPGMFGHHVHEAVMDAYRAGEVNQSAVCMHFVVDKGEDKSAYDKGPVFFQLPVLIRPGDSAETLAERVNEKERAWQAFVLNLVVHGLIRLEKDGEGWKVVYENGLENIIPH